jgi:hypothetical protein
VALDPETAVDVAESYGEQIELELPRQQPDDTVPSPQTRIEFLPSVEEILEIALPHLESGPRAMISFGQGCEGEPLLQAELIERAIRAIRTKTKSGTLHLNTNGSRPDAVERLADAGLDSIRVSLNSGPKPTRPTTAAHHASRTCRHSPRCREGLFRAGYLVFPGVTIAWTKRRRSSDSCARRACA